MVLKMGTLKNGTQKVTQKCTQKGVLEYRAHRSAPVRQHCQWLCCRPTLCAVICRVRSADTRADGHGRADQRRRHQPAHARTDVRADARAELRRPGG